MENRRKFLKVATTGYIGHIGTMPLTIHTGKFSSIQYDKTNEPTKNDKIGRNSICTCGSNLKYKNCCLNK